MPATFDVFLSHNSRDKEAVQEIAAALKRRGLQPWLDVEQLRPGMPWKEGLEEAMASMGAAAVFYGENEIGAWQEPEVRVCLSQMVKRRQAVIPVLLPGAPKEPKIGLFLGEYTWVDLRTGITEEGLDRLVWGITGEKPLHDGASETSSTDHSARSAARLPPPPRCFGRSTEVQTLVAAVCAEPPRPVPVLGPGGVGKTTVTVAALHDPRVAERFGGRRWFIRCDGATSRDALIGEIVTGLGLEPGGQLEERVFRELEREPALLVLDNAETPWEGDLERVEDLLAQLAALPGLALVAPIRGAEVPGGPAWCTPVRVGPLAQQDARAAFLAVAGDRFGSDSLLETVLQAVEGLALAVTLLAHQAQAEEDLSELWLRWQTEKTDLLRRGDSRLLSLKASLETSIQKSPRMTEDARRLLSLLGLLPDGIAHGDLDALLPETGRSAAATLRKVGLAFSQGARLRVLAPVREQAARRHPPSQEDLRRARNHYLALAATGNYLEQEGGSEAARRLGPETGNLEAMVLGAQASPEAMASMKAVLGLTKLFLSTGLGSPIFLDQALGRAKDAGEAKEEAERLQWLGHIAFWRSDHAAARDHFNKALPIYKRVGDARGEADCILSLGDIALRCSDHDAALAHFAEALPLYRHVGSTLGEANCLQSLGNIALERSDHDAARARYEEALPLYRQLGSVLGEANCLRGLGDIDHASGDLASAKTRFGEALGLYSRIQDPFSIGWVHVRLVWIENDHEARCRQFAAARDAWTRIKRPDLVELLEQEFGAELPGTTATPASGPTPGGG